MTKKQVVKTSIYVLIIFCLAYLTASLFSCSTYQYASNYNMKLVPYENKAYYATQETEDSIYIEVLDKWIAIDSTLAKRLNRY